MRDNLSRLFQQNTRQDHQQGQQKGLAPHELNGPEQSTPPLYLARRFAWRFLIKSSISANMAASLIILIVIPAPLSPERGRSSRNSNTRRKREPILRERIVTHAASWALEGSRACCSSAFLGWRRSLHAADLDRRLHHVRDKSRYERTYGPGWLPRLLVILAG